MYMAMNWRYISALCFAICFGEAIGFWENDYDGKLDFRCSSTKDAIVYVKSIHSNWYEDRRFDFRCSKVNWRTENPTCSWSNWVNDWDQTVHYNCPNGGYMNGWKSYHDNGKEDRRHQFYCCRPRNWPVHLSTCSWTGFLNNWDGELNYSVPGESFVQGVYSIHSNRAEDRRFKFHVCKHP